MAVGTDIASLLGYVTLCGTIERIKSGLPKVLPEAFSNIKTSTIADTGSYMRVTGTRQTARLVQYGGPSVRRDLKGIESIPVKLLHTFENIEIGVVAYQQLRALDSYTNDKGREELARQMREFAMYDENLRNAATVSALFQGKIWFDSGGNLLPSSSGAAVTVDFAIPANNLNQFNGIIGASWANHATDIPGQIRALKAQALKDTGYPLTHCFYGANVPSYIALNDYIQPWFVRHEAQRAKYAATGEIPDGFFGIEKWIPAYEAFYEDNSNVNQSFVGADAVTFTPDITADIYEMMEGTYPVPTSFQPTQNPSNPIADFTQVAGAFAYGKPWDDPPTAKVYRGDTFLPLLKVPGAYYIGDCTP